MAPTGDWDGARFDAGIIDRVSTLGAYTAVVLDRWSFTGPDGTTRDGDALDAEPIAAWWTINPYIERERAQPHLRAGAPTVEVLTLDPADQARACAQPPPASPPAPRWTAAPVGVGPHPRGLDRRAHLLAHRPGHPHPPHPRLLTPVP